MLVGDPIIVVTQAYARLPWRIRVSRSFRRLYRWLKHGRA